MAPTLFPRPHPSAVSFTLFAHPSHCLRLLDAQQRIVVVLETESAPVASAWLAALDARASLLHAQAWNRKAAAEAVRTAEEHRVRRAAVAAELGRTVLLHALTLPVPQEGDLRCGGGINVAAVGLQVVALGTAPLNRTEHGEHATYLLRVFFLDTVHRHRVSGWHLGLRSDEQLAAATAASAGTTEPRGLWVACDVGDPGSVDVLLEWKLSPCMTCPLPLLLPVEELALRLELLSQ